jgi:hypothetical protein
MRAFEVIRFPSGLGGWGASHTANQQCRLLHVVGDDLEYHANAPSHLHRVNRWPIEILAKV